MSRKTATTRRAIAMPDELWQAIEAYREREAITTTAEALRRLVVLATRYVAKEAEKR